MRNFLIAACVLCAAAPAIAQTTPASPASPPAMTPGAMTPGSPARANSGPGATGVTTGEGTGAGTVTNNAAGGSNAEQPSRAVPNTGSTGGGGSGG